MHHRIVKKWPLHISNWRGERGSNIYNYFKRKNLFKQAVWREGKKNREKKRLVEKKKVRKIELSEREESQYRFFVSITYEIVFFSGGEAFAGRELKTSQAELNEKKKITKKFALEMEGIIFSRVFFFFAKNLFFFLNGFWRSEKFKKKILNFPKKKKTSHWRIVALYRKRQGKMAFFSD